MLQLENDSQGKAGARPLHLIDGNQNHASLSIGPKESSAAKVHGNNLLFNCTIAFLFEILILF